MIRALLACVAAAALAAAIPAHLGGFEDAAETCGTIAFAALLAAVILPARRGEADDDPR